MMGIVLAQTVLKKKSFITVYCPRNLKQLCQSERRVRNLKKRLLGIVIFDARGSAFSSTIERVNVGRAPPTRKKMESVQ